MAAPMLPCERCAGTFATAPMLEQHLVEFHCMGARQAQSETRHLRRRSVNRAPAPVRNDPAPTTGHICPTCQVVIPCDWQAVAALDEQAHSLKIMAGLWKARLNGSKIGRPRLNTFDVEAARTLVLEGMSYRGVAEALGATSASAVERALMRAPRSGQARG